MASLQQAIDFAKANPNTPQSTELRRRIETGQMDAVALREGIQLPGRTLAPTTEIPPIAEKKVGTLEDIKETGAGIAEAGIAGGDKLKNIIEATKKGEQTLLEGLFQVAGEAAGTGAEVVGETAVGVAKTLVPEVIEKIPGQAIGGLGEFGAALIAGLTRSGEGLEGREKVKQDMAKQFLELSEGVEEFKKAHPRLARNIGALFGFGEAALTAAGVKPTKKVVEEAGVATKRLAREAATGLETSAAASELAAKEKFVRELVRPTQTKKVKEAQVARTTEEGGGILKKSVIEPTLEEKSAAQAILETVDIDPKATVQQNFNKIQAANRELAQKLEKDILENDFIISKREIKAKLNAATEELKESPTIVGDAQKTAEKLMNKMIKIVDENAGKGSGVLKSRKDYDAWVRTQKAKAFDATSENAFTLANRAIRKVLNDVLDKKATSVSVKDSLRKQSSLFRAMDNIIPKAALEADTAIGRMFQRAAKLLGTKNKVVQAAAAVAGIGGLGAAATFAPAASVLGGLSFGAWKAGQFVMSPKIRSGMAKILRAIEKAIPTAKAAEKAELTKLSAELNNMIGEK